MSKMYNIAMSGVITISTKQFATARKSIEDGYHEKGAIGL